MDEQQYHDVLLTMLRLGHKYSGSKLPAYCERITVDLYYNDDNFFNIFTESEQNAAQGDNIETMSIRDRASVDAFISDPKVVNSGTQLQAVSYTHLRAHET